MTNEAKPQKKESKQKFEKEPIDLDYDIAEDFEVPYPEADPYDYE